MGILINANLAADALADYEPGKQGLLDNEVVLCKAAEGNVHILVALREHIHGALVVPVVLVPVDGGGAEGLIGAVVVFDTGFIDDNTTVLDHHFANIILWIELVAAGDGYVGIDRLRTLEERRSIQQPAGEFAGMVTRPGDETGLSHTLFGQVGGKGSLTAARDAEIDVEDGLRRTGQQPTVELETQDEQEDKEQHSKTSIDRIRGQGRATSCARALPPSHLA